MRPARFQKACHQAACSAGSVLDKASPMLASLVLHRCSEEQATITRKWPSVQV